MSDELTAAIKDAVPRVRVGPQIAILPVDDWSRIVGLATADDPPPRELYGPEGPSND